MKNELIKPAGLVKNANRRQFLKRGTLSVATAGLLLVGCNDDEMMPMDGGVGLESGDFGILNYAYALEQLEAAFYAAVLGGGYFANANAEENTIMGDLEKHESTHREFFKAALGSMAIANLEIDLYVCLQLHQLKSKSSSLYCTHLHYPLSRGKTRINGKKTSNQKRPRYCKGLDHKWFTRYTAGPNSGYLYWRRKRISWWSECGKSDRNRCRRCIGGLG